MFYTCSVVPAERDDFKIQVMKKWDKDCYGPLVVVSQSI